MIFIIQIPKYYIFLFYMIICILILLILILILKKTILEYFSNFNNIKTYISNPISQKILEKNFKNNYDQNNCLDEKAFIKSLNETIDSININNTIKNSLKQMINTNKNLYNELLVLKRKHNSDYPNKICKSDINLIMSLFIKKYLNNN